MYILILEHMQTASWSKGINQIKHLYFS